MENKKASALLEKSQRPQRLCDEVINLMHLNQLSSKIIGAAIEVHKSLGPGLLESADEECLCHELQTSGIGFERQKPPPVQYNKEERRISPQRRRERRDERVFIAKQ